MKKFLNLCEILYYIDKLNFNMVSYCLHCSCSAIDPNSYGNPLSFALDDFNFEAFYKNNS